VKKRAHEQKKRLKGALSNEDKLSFDLILLAETLNPALRID
jgi:hypothetical protein